MQMEIESMHTIKLKVQDSIYSHIMFLLKSLNPQELEIIEDEKVDTKQSMKTSIKNLFDNKNFKAFETIDDPLKWQEEQRKEW